MAKVVTNADKVAGALEGVSSDVRAKVLPKVIRAMVKPLVGAAKKQITKHNRTGLLRRSIQSVVKRYRSGTTYGAVGPVSDLAGMTRGKKPRVIRPVKYAHLLHGGVKPHALKKGMHPGFTGTPFLAKAFDEQRGRIETEGAAVASEEINRLGGTS